MECVFCKIKEGKIPAKFIYQDKDVFVIPDIHPEKPVHLLIIPQKHVSEFLVVDDTALFARIGKVIQEMIRKHDLNERGYKIVINGGGSQDVDHLHIHLLGPMKSAS